MGYPEGTRSRRVALSNGDTVQLFSLSGRLVLRVRHTASPEAGLLAPSFDVAVELAPYEALAVAEELLAAVLAMAKKERVELSHGASYTAPA